MASSKTTTVLHQYGPDWGLPSICPFCVAAQAYLKLLQIPFDTNSSGNAAISPSGELPAVESPEAIVSARYGMGQLRDALGVQLDDMLSDLEASEVHAYTTLVEAKLERATLLTQWVDRDNYTGVTRLAYAAKLPYPLSYMIPGGIRRRMMKATQLKGGEAEEERVMEEAKHALESLSVKLAGRKTSGPFFFGKTPSSIDATLLGLLLFHLHAPFPNAPLKDFIKKLPGIESYANELKDIIFGDDNTTKWSAPQPPTSGSKSRGSWFSSSKKTKKKRSEKEQRFRRRSRNAIIFAAVVVLGYALLNESVVQFVEIEEDEDEE